jgi:5-methylcytosine-specific restriction endonuclease McrA
VHRLQTANQRCPKANRSRRSGGTVQRAVAPAPDGPLHASVLVLNRLYMAIHVVNVRRAFGLLFRELAEVIHLEEGLFANYNFQSWREVSGLRADSKQPYDDWIRAVNFEIQVPRVIRLLGFDRLPKQNLHLNRRTVLARDGHVCQYCGGHFPSHQLSLDHVVPRSLGGRTTWENVVCACLICNIKKGGRTPKEARMRLVRRPTKPKRNPVLLLKLTNPKYESWKTWLDGVRWEVGATG